jgi:serine phosphatase RsbU (regulator of sigma subunit)
VAAALLPAEHAVAGDFYLLTNGPGGWSVVLVGDVVGHGIEAAQRATFVRVSLVSICAGSADPAEILRLANRAVYEQTNADGRFVTCAVWRSIPGSPRSVGPAPDTNRRFT